MSTATGRLTIDLSAVQANWRRVSTQTPSPPAAVIKADAYGLGADPVGNSLYRAGCREFFLATLEEAIAARQFLPADARLYVLGGARPGEERECMAQGLVPVLYSLPAIQRWARACRAEGRAAPSAVKIDTGMTRLGLSDSEWQQLREDSALLKSAHPILWMSHLACADEYDHPMNRQQQEAFARRCAEVRTLMPDIRCSLANSSGIFLGADWHFDLARTGAALYGYDPHLDRAPAMQPVVQLELPVLQVRELTGKASIGYGATEQRPAGARLAVVAGGYADGLNRTIGRQGAKGMLGDREVPVVGRISMDTTVFDVTGAALPAQPEQAYVRVLDERLTLSHVTHRSGALGYEVLTSLAGRYRRFYRDQDAHAPN